MKKSELKQLIKESIKQIILEDSNARTKVENILLDLFNLTSKDSLKSLKLDGTDSARALSFALHVNIEDTNFKQINQNIKEYMQAAINDINEDSSKKEYLNNSTKLSKGDIIHYGRF